MGKVAIVIGATGLVGSALVDQLVDAEHISKIITLTRKVTHHSSSKVHNHVVDFEHLEESAVFFKADLLFSALGTTRRKAGSIDAQRKVDVNYQFNAAQLAAKHGVTHYLLVSSTGANQHSGRPYLKMKGELESKVQTLSFSRITILQPSLLVGSRDHFRFAEKFAFYLMRMLCIVPTLRRFRPITGIQVARMLTLKSQLPGPAFELLKLDQLFIAPQPK